MSAVSTTKRTFARERSILMSSGGMSRSLGPAWLEQPQSEWPEQVNLVFASYEGKIPSSVFMTHTEENKAVIKWEQFSNFSRLVNTIESLERALSKYKPTALVVSAEESEKAKAIILGYYSKNILEKR